MSVDRSAPSAITAGPASRLRLAVVGGVLLLLAGFGVMRAVQLAWVCDDAFLSFRYAENLIEGRGLVYNQGEYVEGYTNLLWTLMLALCAKLGLPIVAASKVLGIGCWLALAAVAARWSWLRARERGHAFLPLAAALVLVTPDFHDWATGGLETMLFAWLTTHALVNALSDREARWAPLVAGVLFALLVLTRPDGLLVVGAGVLCYWAPTRRIAARLRRRSALLTGVPVAVTVAALACFKLAYYGELFPTAYYSKSVTSGYYVQGLHYVGLYFFRNWFLVPAFVLLFVFVRPSRAEGAPRSVALPLVLFGSAGLFIAYLVHVGGDFMYARRVIPVVPLLYLALEDRIARWPSWALRAALSAALLVAASFPVTLYDSTTKRIRGIANERSFYPAPVMAARRAQGEALGAIFRGTDVRVMFEGGMLVFGYYSKLPYLVEMTGLTQYSLAKLPISQRGYIGHEKAPSDEWLEQNAIDVLVTQSFPPVDPSAGPREFDEVYFGRLARGRILRYSERLVSALESAPEVGFFDIQTVLAANTEQIRRTRSRAEAEAVYRTLDRYYFRCGGETARREGQALREIVDSK